MAALLAGAFFAALKASPLQAAGSLQAIGTQVQTPGGVGQVCVLLSSDQQVAGIQADIRWDGNCATFVAHSCSPAGSHGKDVHQESDRQPTDFTVKVLVLSLSDVDPIPDGPVFCCSFQGEAEPGECCSLSLTNVQGSDPKGTAIAVNPGSPASICTSSSGRQPGRGFGSPAGNQPLSASNQPPAPAGGAAAPAPVAPAAPAGGGAARPVQVLPGGGVRVEPQTGGVAAAPTPGAIQLPTPAAPPPTAGARAVAPPTEAATAEATSAPTDAPTARQQPPTPAKRTASVPTVSGAPPKPAAQSAAKEESRWFGCQIDGASSAGAMLGLACVALLGVAVRRRWRG